ncbi:MAG: hypothetical protein EOM66_05485 [Clostridia bacterium]|nr:hypothetical protein [Clostridia bacterium]
MAELADRYYGILVGSLAGDAMGAPTEGKSTRHIAACFGGRVENFMVPPDDCLSRGRKAYQITDAASIPLLLCRQIIAEKAADRSVARRALLAWGDSEWFGPFAGMTTRKVVNALKKNSRISDWSYAGHLGNKLYKTHYYALSSNGSAVKAYPAAMLHPGDMDAAIGCAVELTMASHDDPISISGACGIAAAISHALGGKATGYTLGQAALYGARQGEDLAKKERDIWVYPGPSVVDRIEMAAEIAVRCGVSAMEELRDVVGNGPSVAETVPSALGLLIAHGGRTLPAMYDAVNMGDETAAIASLVGTIGGAMEGVGIFPRKWIPALEKANGIEIRPIAQGMLDLL